LSVLSELGREASKIVQGESLRGAQAAPRLRGPGSCYWGRGGRVSEAIGCAEEARGQSPLKKKTTSRPREGVGNGKSWAAPVSLLILLRPFRLSLHGLGSQAHGQVRKKKVRILNSDLDCPSRQFGEVIVCFSFWACANRRVLFSQNFHFLNEWFGLRNGLRATSLLAWPASPFSLSPPGHGGVRCPAPGEDRTGLQAW
jgi:hypothetical protein